VKLNLAPNAPEQLKYVGDGVAFLTSLAAIAGQLTTIVGLIGATAAAVWGIFRAINEYKIYKNRK
jgi:hypothetical protein